MASSSIHAPHWRIWPKAFQSDFMLVEQPMLTVRSVTSNSMKHASDRSNGSVRRFPERFGPSTKRTFMPTTGGHRGRWRFGSSARDDQHPILEINAHD